MPHIKSSDRALVSAIERWMETARNTVDDIVAWRYHLSERIYHPTNKLDDGFGPLTAFLIGHIQAETHLDPSAIQSVHATLTLWDAAPDSDDLPPQKDIVRDLERSLVVVTAIRDGIINAAGRKTTEQVADLPGLSPLALEILPAMLELGAVDSDHRTTADEVAKRATNGIANQIKKAMAELKKLGLVDSKKGGGGGTWLTPQGIDRAKNIIG